MKRGLSAFSEQTVKFMFKEGNVPEQAVSLVHRKFETCKTKLERKNVE